MVDPEAHYHLASGLLGLSRKADADAAQRLSDLLAPRKVVEPRSLARAFRGKTSIILGTAPSGIERLDAVDAKARLVVAGSAIGPAHAAGLRPALLVTDLDGSEEAHVGCSRAGVPMAVHAHGDNVALLEQLVPKLDGPLFGTAQTEPPAKPTRMHRFGGFTDGDRACFLAAALGASELVLVGWDLEDARPDTPTKRVKLEIAGLLLDDLPVPWRFV